MGQWRLCCMCAIVWLSCQTGKVIPTASTCLFEYVWDLERGHCFHWLTVHSFLCVSLSVSEISITALRRYSRCFVGRNYVCQPRSYYNLKGFPELRMRVKLMLRLGGGLLSQFFLLVFGISYVCLYVHVYSPTPPSICCVCFSLRFAFPKIVIHPSCSLSLFFTSLPSLIFPPYTLSSSLSLLLPPFQFPPSSSSVSLFILI